MGRGLNTRVGEKIGKVTVASRAGSVMVSNSSVATWNVKCECGKEWIAKSNAITRARKIGNWQCRPCTSAMRNKYGTKGHYLYQTWQGMVQRCYNKKATSYESYGGRGIGIYHEWLADPLLFVKWCDNVLGKRPEGHTLDRINNDGNYEPDNLRWADKETQASNRRNSK